MQPPTTHPSPLFSFEPFFYSLFLTRRSSLNISFWNLAQIRSSSGAINFLEVQFEERSTFPTPHNQRHQSKQPHKTNLKPPTTPKPHNPPQRKPHNANDHYADTPNGTLISTGSKVVTLNNHKIALQTAHSSMLNPLTSPSCDPKTNSQTMPQHRKTSTPNYPNQSKHQTPKTVQQKQSPKYYHVNNQRTTPQTSRTTD